MTSPGRRPARAAGERGATCGTRTPPAVPAGRPAESRRASSAAFSRVSCSILMPMYGRATRPRASSCARAAPPQRRAGGGLSPPCACLVRRVATWGDTGLAATAPPSSSPSQALRNPARPAACTRRGRGGPNQATLPQAGQPRHGAARGGDLVDDRLRGVDRDRERDAVRADRQQRGDAHHLRAAARVGAPPRRRRSAPPLHPPRGSRSLRTPPASARPARLGSGARTEPSAAEAPAARRLRRAPPRAPLRSAAARGRGSAHARAHLACQVDQRPAAVARVDGRVRLDVVRVRARQAQLLRLRAAGAVRPRR